MSVVLCRLPNSFTTIYQLVADLLAVSLTSLQQAGNFSVYGETCVMDFGPKLQLSNLKTKCVNRLRLLSKFISTVRSGDDC